MSKSAGGDLNLLAGEAANGNRSLLSERSPSGEPTSSSMSVHDSSTRTITENNYGNDDFAEDCDDDEDDDGVGNNNKSGERPMLFKTGVQPSEEETVLTSASSQMSLTPENPLFGSSGSASNSYGKNLYEGALSSFRSSKDAGVPHILQQRHNSLASSLTTNTTMTLNPAIGISNDLALSSSALFVDRSSSNSRPVFRSTPSSSSRAESMPPDFNKSPEPIPNASNVLQPKQPLSTPLKEYAVPLKSVQSPQAATVAVIRNELPPPPPTHSTSSSSTSSINNYFQPQHRICRWLEVVSKILLRRSYSPDSAATWIGFWALMLVTCANYVLTPMRDAIALAVGVEHIPNLTLASTILAVFSSVPIGWLFEAPDPKRRKLWKRMGLTRGETQGTSLALFYRCFALILLSYSLGFKGVELVSTSKPVISAWPAIFQLMNSLLQSLGHVMYIAFFLMVHLMKLHSLSLIWGVTTEAMDYEDVARNRHQPGGSEGQAAAKSRLQRLGLVSFGGTLGGILGR